MKKLNKASQIDKLNYRGLQAQAKLHGIPANQKTEALQAALRKALDVKVNASEIAAEQMVQYHTGAAAMPPAGQANLQTVSALLASLVSDVDAIKGATVKTPKPKSAKQVELQNARAKAWDKHLASYLSKAVKPQVFLQNVKKDCVTDSYMRKAREQVNTTCTIEALEVAQDNLQVSNAHFSWAKRRARRK